MLPTPLSISFDVQPVILLVISYSAGSYGKLKCPFLMKFPYSIKVEGQGSSFGKRLLNFKLAIVIPCASDGPSPLNSKMEFPDCKTEIGITWSWTDLSEGITSKIFMSFQ